MDQDKLNIPVTILIASLILGGFYYSVQVKKQESIERQHNAEQALQIEQSNREYVIKQKEACLNIYTTEGKKWNNIESWDYDVEDDKCVITYKNLDKKTQAECDADLQVTKDLYKGEEVPSVVYQEYLYCSMGIFTKEF
jgi:glucan phosphorylase